MESGPLTDVRQTRTSVLGLFLVLDYALVTLAVLLLAAGTFAPVSHATRGLLSQTLLVNLLVGLVAAGVVLGPGRLRPEHIGLIRSKLPFGIAVTVGLWAVVEVIEAVLALVMDGSITLAPDWSEIGATATVGLLLGQLFGNALYEDVAYRGFLFPQLLLKARARWPTDAGRAMAGAMVVSQVLFALRHVPGDLVAGTGPAAIALHLLIVTVIGIALVLLYRRTGNLFIVIGVHALIDAPTPLIRPTLIGPSYLVIALGVLLLLLWPHDVRRSPTLQSADAVAGSQAPGA